MKKQYIIPQINIVALEYSTHIMEASVGVEIMSGKADKDEEVLSREYDSWDDVY